MVPMVPPPPPVASSNKTLDLKAPLDTMVHKLRDLIFGITLPKTRTAKTAAITIKVLCLICGLVESACALLQECHKNPQLDDIN